MDRTRNGFILDSSTESASHWEGNHGGAPDTILIDSFLVFFVQLVGLDHVLLFTTLQYFITVAVPKAFLGTLVLELGDLV